MKNQCEMKEKKQTCDKTVENLQIQQLSYELIDTIKCRRSDVTCSITVVQNLG